MKRGKRRARRRGKNFIICITKLDKKMTRPQGFPFNVRVYGICFNEKMELLVTDEIIRDQEVSKFPGGGLEFGEGTIDGLKREFIEETGNEVDVSEHFYTT